MRVFDGIDWYWLPSMLRAVRFVLGERPEVMVLQWWSGTVLHSYLALALLARLRGTRIVIEFHEVLDTGELRLPLVKPYTALVGAAVVRLADAFVVHSEFDRDLLATHYRLGRRPVSIVRHGPYDHYSGTAGSSSRTPSCARRPPTPSTCCSSASSAPTRASRTSSTPSTG